MVYPALLPLMLTPRLPVVDCTDVPADLNGIERFAERRNLVSARMPSHFNWTLLLCCVLATDGWLLCRFQVSPTFAHFCTLKISRRCSSANTRWLFFGTENDIKRISEITTKIGLVPVKFWDFPLRWPWRLPSCGMWRHVSWIHEHLVSGGIYKSIFRA